MSFWSVKFTTLDTGFLLVSSAAPKLCIICVLKAPAAIVTAWSGFKGFTVSTAVVIKSVT